MRWKFIRRRASAAIHISTGLCAFACGSIYGPKRTTALVLNFGCSRQRCRAELSEGMVRSAQTFRKKCKLVIRVDVDPIGKGNQEIDEFRLIEGPRLPVEDSSIDLCVGDRTVRHLSDIPGFFSGCPRVIRTGGYLCFRTPNRFHFSSLGASMIPTRYHHSNSSNARSVS